MSETSEDPLDDLLEFLKDHRGFDFTGYKRSGLERRIAKRTEALGITDYAAYVEHLEVYPDEFATLFDTILINVTDFFRDPDVWSAIQGQILPALLGRKDPGDPIRVWSASCASGQEAYSLAMLLADAIGLDDFRDRVKIYGTDVDEQALADARQATYRPDQITSIPKELRELYLEPAHGGYVVSKALRRAVIFGRHNLAHDAPISRIDLLACRNSLMYFNAETQAQILGRLHFALRPAGYLVLGAAEMLLGHADRFVSVDVKNRIFTKAAAATRERFRVLDGGLSEGWKRAGDSAADLLGAALLSDPAPKIIIDPDGVFSAANVAALDALDVSAADIGRPFYELELSYRPVELRSMIAQAAASGAAVAVFGAEWSVRAGVSRWFDVHVVPLRNAAGAALGVVVHFNDVTSPHHLHAELEAANRELENAYAELQATNEELETTNEELQSTIEELETTNEELQSTNEELETINAELRSTNEELQAINEELRLRTTELHSLNAFMEAVLTSLRAGVAVIDRDLRVKVWNDRAEDLWGVRSDEVAGQPLPSLDIGLPVGELTGPIRRCLDGSSDQQELVVSAVNRRGRTISCRVGFAPLFSLDGSAEGVILLMEQVD